MTYLIVKAVLSGIIVMIVSEVGLLLRNRQGGGSQIMEWLREQPE